MIISYQIRGIQKLKTVLHIPLSNWQ